MQFTLKLADGRMLRDAAHQVLAIDSAGCAIMLAYIVQTDIVVCAHRSEPTWSDFLEDAGYSFAERIVTSSAQVLAQIQPESGGVTTLPMQSLCIYSDMGDPIIGMYTDGAAIDCCHCAEDRWADFRKTHSIHQPREHTLVNV